jgi:hypothetical protein
MRQLYFGYGADSQNLSSYFSIVSASGHGSISESPLLYTCGRSTNGSLVPEVDVTIGVLPVRPVRCQDWPFQFAS